MESEGGSKRSADQLQSLALQDQAVRPLAAGPRIAPQPIHALSSAIYKVVVRFEDHAVRGFAKASDLGSVEQLLRNDPQHSLETIRLTIEGTGSVREVPIGNAKAVFFVATFDGDTHHRALHFHENAPVKEGLWIRVRFHDNESIEGIISNSHDYVLGNGFFMMPTDPDGNNKLIYVLKSRLTGFQVLGLRNAPRTPVL